MTRAVLDTNVLAAAFVSPYAPPGQLLQAWLEGRYVLALSPIILVELGRTFQQPYFQRRLTIRQRDNDLALLRRKAEQVAIAVQVQGIATHPEDDQILATAVSSSADFLVTGDGQLLRLGSYEGIAVVTPRQFLEILEQAARRPS